jgi:lipopolysaccharide export system protein LptC
MSSLTNMAHNSLSPAAARASRRAQRAPYVSAGFALVVAVVLLAFAYQAGFFSLFTLPQPQRPASQPAEQITVSHSTITGFDQQQQPYSVTAQSAIQDKDVPNHIHLNALSGNIRRGNGDTIDVKANSGLYDTEGKTLDLSGAVEIISKGKFIARMDKAHVIVKEKRLVANTPVAVEMPNGTIDAKALQITNDGNNILFFNGVHARFKSSGAKGDTSP